jgi:hypothetical protein
MKLNFMKDVPSMTDMDFNQLDLQPVDWKLLARVDGRNNLEEVRLLAGLTREQAMESAERLFERGVIKIRREF